MDRRQKKSREAIFSAFNRLLEKKHFNKITVQEIIDEADVGRTTFYSHFETKEMLVKEMCGEVFSHVFSANQHSEDSHDFSREKKGLSSELTHLLYHLRDNKGTMSGLLSGNSSEQFRPYFKEMLNTLFVHYPECLPGDVPEGYALAIVVGGFAETVDWWTGGGMNTPPEEVVSYFLRVIMGGKADE